MRHFEYFGITKLCQYSGITWTKIFPALINNINIFFIFLFFKFVYLETPPYTMIRRQSKTFQFTNGHAYKFISI